MKKRQKSIFYIMREAKAVKNSPFLVTFNKFDLEVLYLVDSIDKYMIGHIEFYEGKKVISCVKEDQCLGGET